jgi:hypothetical protein
MTENNAFDFFDFSEEEAEQQAREFESDKYDRDGRICICGHPMKRHTSFNGMTTCSPSRLICPCKKSRPVIESSDTRVFLRKTRGSGSSHALAQGILAARGKHEITWLIEMKCDKCGAEGKISPVAVSQAGIIKDEPTGFDVLLCQKCREESI